VQQPAPSSNGPRNYGITMAANRATLMRAPKNPESQRNSPFPPIPAKGKTHLELCQAGWFHCTAKSIVASITGHKCFMAGSLLIFSIFPQSACYLFASDFGFLCAYLFLLLCAIKNTLRYYKYCGGGGFTFS